VQEVTYFFVSDAILGQKNLSFSWAKVLDHKVNTECGWDSIPKWWKRSKMSSSSGWRKWE